MSSTTMTIRKPAGSAERFFQRSLYLLLVMGFAGLAGTGKLDFLSLVLGGSALVVRGYHLLRKKRSRIIPEQWTNYLTILYFAFYLVDYFLLSQGFVAATVHMVLFIMMVKIFSVQRDRDLLYLAVLSFLMILAAAVLTVDTLFLLTFGMFMLTAMATFISMEMRRSEREERVIRVGPQKEYRFHRSLALVSGLLAVFTLAGAVIIFFILPRMDSRGYLRNFGTQNDLITGFSDAVNLGGIGRIQQSNEVVMHIQVLHGVMPGDVKWRGTALTNFDGHRWWNPPPDLGAIYPLNGVPLDLRRVRINGSPLYSTAEPAGRNFTLTYRVIMEPIGANVFFLANTPLSFIGAYPEVGISAEGGLINDGIRSIDKYVGEADTRDPEMMVRDSTSRDYPAAISMAYLQLPRLDPRIPELAQRITAASTSNYMRALAIQSYLRQNFGYTLDLPGDEVDPLAHFLFQRKQGHCEYFASSMAVMLRTIGIPSRIVNGFRGAEYNDLTQNYIIRGRDAHSWVEAYFPEYGWVTFDPTPSLPADSGNDAWKRLGLYMDAARELWREWVINYDFSHQMRLSTELSNRTTNMQNKVRFWSWLNYRRLLLKIRNIQQTANISTRKVMVLAIILGLLTALPLSSRLWRSYQRVRLLRNPQHAPRTAASFWYERMLKAIARKGIRKSPAQTAVEFASTIPDPEIKDGVVTFTEHYERARFADSVEDAERLPELYEEMVRKK
jgi:protein-glutamine gamma-glutamyltransferase